MSDTLPPMPEPVQIDKHLPTGVVIRGYTADQMSAYAEAYAAAAVADATKRLQIELENVRAEGLLLAKSAVAVERERCAVLAIDTARAAEQKYKDDPSPVRQPYANNRLMHVGWDIAEAIRAG